MRFTAGLVLTAVAALFVQTHATQAADGYGSISGQIIFEGDIPKLAPIIKQGDGTVRDAACCSKNSVPNEAIVVDPKTNGLANVFVFLPKVDKADIHPDLQKSKEESVVQDQKDCKFIPHALVVRTDQAVLVKSDDPVSHNALIQPFLNTPINNTVPPNYRKGVPYKFTMAESFPSTLSCSIHAWMNARWLIVDHPYATVSKADGTFKIENLPAGEHSFNVWHERGGWIFRHHRSPKYTALKVTVKANENVDVGKIKVAAEKFDIKPEELAK